MKGTLMLRSLVLSVLAFVWIGAALAADPIGPGPNPTTPYCQNAAGTGYVPCGSGGSGGIPVQPPIPAVVVTGQALIAVTNTAVQLPSNALVNGLVVKAKSTNSASCGTVGKSGTTNTYDGTGNGYGLCPGEAASFAVPNSNLLFVNGTGTDIFTFEGN